MRHRCALCGQFKKEEDVFYDTEICNETGLIREVWAECKKCCAPVDYERHFKNEEG